MDDSDPTDIFKSLTSDLNDEVYSKLLRKTIREVYKVPDVVKKAFADLKINLSHDIPIAHRVGACGKSVREILEISDQEVKTKRFSKAEDQVIHKNWKRFCEEYGFEDPTPFLTPHSGSYFKVSERLKFAQYLGNGLPHRTLKSIYERFRTLNSDCKNNKSFTIEEDKLIYYHCNKGSDSNAYATLSRILRRPRRSIYQRMCLIKNHLKGNINWNYKLATFIVKALMKITRSANVEDLKNKKISEKEWKKLEKSILINARSAKKFWNRKLKTQLFLTQPLYLNETKIHIIQRLYEDNVQTWNEVRWSKIAKDIEGATPAFLKQLFIKFVKKYYPRKELNEIKENLGDVVRDLKDNLPKLRNTLKEEELERLTMKKYYLSPIRKKL